MIPPLLSHEALLPGPILVEQPHAQWPAAQAVYSASSQWFCLRSRSHFTTTPLPATNSFVFRSAVSARAESVPRAVRPGRNRLLPATLRFPIPQRHPPRGRSLH